MAKFKVGDRVVLKKSVELNRVPLGTTGTVCVIFSDNWIGVSWDNFDNGHSCSATLPNKSGWNVTPDSLTPLIEEAKPEVAPPPPAKPKPSKPVKPEYTAAYKPADKPWSIEVPLPDLDEILGMIDIKPASDWLVAADQEAAASGSQTAAPKPPTAASEPKPNPKKPEKPKKDECWRCAAFQQIADCAYGFCKSWHNFAGCEEFCSRFKAVETVDN